MPLKRSGYFLLILMIMVSCKSPYKTEKVTFVASQQDIVNRLHDEFNFKNITFSGISLKVNDHQTTDLQVKINDPVFTGKESFFAQKLAKSVKNYVANIDHFNVISIETNVRKATSSGYIGHMKKILFDQKTLKEISGYQYFNMSNSKFK